VKKPDPSSELCLSCGMCCDGTLFGRVEMSAEEAARLGKRVATAEGQLVQPCRALEGLKCCVYADRPGVCRKFKCNVLLALESGEMPQWQAQAKVKHARLLEAELAKVLPKRRAGEPKGAAQRARESMRKSGREQLEDARANEALGALNGFLLAEFGA
jgi:uncharacterized protein